MSHLKSTGQQVEEFLYQEAELIDDWRLPEWSELYTEDARYDVTSLDSPDPINSSAKDSLFLLADDKERLTSRAKRLMKKTAHAEFPHSKVRHIISNVRLDPNASGEIKVRANFIVYRTKQANTRQYIAQTHSALGPQEAGR